MLNIYYYRNATCLPSDPDLSRRDRLRGHVLRVASRNSLAHIHGDGRRGRTFTLPVVGHDLHFVVCVTLSVEDKSNQNLVSNTLLSFYDTCVSLTIVNV